MIPRERELLGPLDLTGAQALHEPRKVVMVGKHGNFVLTPFQVVPLILEDLNGSQKISIRIIFHENYTTSFRA